MEPILKPFMAIPDLNLQLFLVGQAEKFFLVFSEAGTMPELWLMFGICLLSNQT